ncbi:unnamed protein product [Durusdinium trenchii]|uniref:Uncharacterized protein n=1 Tax=Durusdinium trenchii TaxID=1381693 RepID=A0ABP0SGZ4_9DINO
MMVEAQIPEHLPEFIGSQRIGSPTHVGQPQGSGTTPAATAERVAQQLGSAAGGRWCHLKGWKEGTSGEPGVFQLPGRTDSSYHVKHAWEPRKGLRGLVGGVEVQEEILHWEPRSSPFKCAEISLALLCSRFFAGNTSSKQRFKSSSMYLAQRSCFGRLTPIGDQVVTGKLQGQQPESTIDSEGKLRTVSLGPPPEGSQ